ncbi:hypothetical protein BDV96DRAFT_571439 [Lophiotrema nucula]|uniref:Uncharacterized protein n=1 Tax=Lophiotrema nucula TaxID=690887 RepID=A0A6A5ZFA4_9PLEO|nr:hypothetical protein BDV96DRAFT_571439 [Lophiotrema nucula]
MWLVWVHWEYGLDLELGLKFAKNFAAGSQSLVCRLALCSVRVSMRALFGHNVQNCRVLVGSRHGEKHPQKNMD